MADNLDEQDLGEETQTQQDPNSPEALLAQLRARVGPQPSLPGLGGPTAPAGSTGSPGIGAAGSQPADTPPPPVAPSPAIPQPATTDTPLSPAPDYSPEGLRKQWGAQATASNKLADQMDTQNAGLRQGVKNSNAFNAIAEGIMAGNDAASKGTFTGAGSNSTAQRQVLQNLSTRNSADLEERQKLTASLRQRALDQEKKINDSNQKDADRQNKIDINNATNNRFFGVAERNNQTKRDVAQSNRLGHNEANAILANGRAEVARIGRDAKGKPLTAKFDDGSTGVVTFDPATNDYLDQNGQQLTKPITALQAPMSGSGGQSMRWMSFTNKATGETSFVQPATGSSLTPAGQQRQVINPTTGAPYVDDQGNRWNPNLAQDKIIKDMQGQISHDKAIQPVVQGLSQLGTLQAEIAAMAKDPANQKAYAGALQTLERLEQGSGAMSDAKLQLQANNASVLRRIHDTISKWQNGAPSEETQKDMFDIGNELDESKRAIVEARMGDFYKRAKSAGIHMDYATMQLAPIAASTGTKDFNDLNKPPAAAGPSQLPPGTHQLPAVSGRVANPDARPNIPAAAPAQTPQPTAPAATPNKAGTFTKTPTQTANGPMVVIQAYDKAGNPRPPLTLSPADAAKYELDHRVINQKVGP